jgi:hypothetical protein
MTQAPQAIFDCDSALRADPKKPTTYLMAGIVGDTQHSFGYHLSRNALASLGLLDDYSLELTRDGNGSFAHPDLASAWDLHFGPADMILVTNRLIAAAEAKSPLLAGVREICGTTNGTNPHPFDLSRGFDDPNNTQEWDDTHLSHVHVSFHRDVCDDFDAIKGIVDVICGRSATLAPAPTIQEDDVYAAVREQGTRKVFVTNFIGRWHVPNPATYAAWLGNLKKAGYTGPLPADTDSIPEASVPMSTFGIDLGAIATAVGLDLSVDQKDLALDTAARGRGTSPG